MREYGTYATADQTTVTSAELVIATLPGISTDRPGQTIRFEGSALVTLPAGTTGVTLRVREDSLTGTVVGEPAADQIYTAAASSESHSIDVSGTNVGEFSGKTYVLTIELVAAAANGTITQCSLSAKVRP